ncbi:hypothetical protein KKB83_03200 [Patescibacteria group bacterium]|nr:hypothetical protein [Patescibacteria group bacterium]
MTKNFPALGEGAERLTPEQQQRLASIGQQAKAGPSEPKRIRRAAGREQRAGEKWEVSEYRQRQIDGEPGYQARGRGGVRAQGDVPPVTIQGARPPIPGGDLRRRDSK